MTTKKKSPGRKLLGGLRTAGLVGLAVAGGWALRALLAPSAESSTEPHVRHDAAAPEEPPQVWTCSMHPQVRLPVPGLCPICEMDLVLEEPEVTPSESQRELRLSPEAVARMRLTTSQVERRFVETQVRMVGKIDYDETRLAEITAWVSGRLDRLFVDFTGVEVKRGDHLVSLFSPKLIVAQTELLQSLERVRSLESDGAQGQRLEGELRTLDAVRERLRQLGLTSEQITEIETRGTPTDQMTIHAPMGGIVVHKSAQQGMQVSEGAHLYTIADLSRLWVLLEAYEPDLQWLHYGQTVEFTTPAHPGETFTGTVAFIDPVVDDLTRTAKIRVNLSNPDGKLKPNMFVSALVRTRVAAGGRVMDPELAGMWICPMHPEIVSEDPGVCDICEMALVTTESRGYVTTTASERERPLVVPATAVLVTGQRAVVYVQDPEADEPTYEGREIVLGPRAGDWYLVESGLSEGERVVTHGNFKIDSALQIKARPSMMAPGGGGGASAHDHLGAQRDAEEEPHE